MGYVVLLENTMSSPPLVNPGLLETTMISPYPQTRRLPFLAVSQVPVPGMAKLVMFE